MGTQLQEKTAERIIGRYAIYDEIASGGMAVVHIGRLLGQAGFSRTVAIKRLHPQFAKDPAFVSMFLDEARLAVRVQHPNVVAPLDVLVVQGEILVVMEYVAGDTLARLQRSPVNAAHPPNPAVMTGILCDALYGLHAAHEALGENGQPLHIVHRDVTPQNIMAGTDGIARVLDFGVAKAAMRSQCTTEGIVKGKVAYMAPEQVEAKELDRRTDIFAAGIVAWEALTGQRLFGADQAAESIAKILQTKVDPPSKYRSDISTELDGVVLKALKRNPRDRFRTAREFAAALEHACPPATPSAIGDWVRSVGGEALTSLAERVAAIEAKSASSMIRPVQPPPALSGTIPLRVPPPEIKSVSRIQLDSHPRITVPLNIPPSPELADQVPTVRPRDMAARRHTVDQKRFRIFRNALIIAMGPILGIGLVMVGALWATRSPVDQKASPSVNRAAVASESLAASARMPTPPKPAAEPANPTNVPLPNLPASATADDSASRTASSVRSATPKTLVRNRPKADPAPPAKSSSKAKVTVDCSPPYYVDSKGIR